MYSWEHYANDLFWSCFWWLLEPYKPKAQLNALDLLAKWDTQRFHYLTFLSTCSHSVGKSVLWVLSPANIQAIPYLHWLKGIRKAAAWGQVCCKTSVCTLIRTALCRLWGSEPHIVACIYLHVQVASPFNCFFVFDDCGPSADTFFDTKWCTCPRTAVFLIPFSLHTHV